MNNKTIVIIGAGPAGLTAALELLRGARCRVIVLEASGELGGISKTVRFKGNRIDIGGHRFFSKSDWVMDWWQEILPIASPEVGAGLGVEPGHAPGAGPELEPGRNLAPGGKLAPGREVENQNARRTVRPRARNGERPSPGNAAASSPPGLTSTNPDAGRANQAQARASLHPDSSDQVLLVRNRLSRIYFEGRFFSYPVKANLDTALKLGPVRVGRMLGSYAWARAFPRRPEVSLEDFLLNRFGRALYETFFKHYTEKVWGVPCTKISAEWGAQRIKGLSVTRALVHALKAPLTSLGLGGGAGKVNTSLIERFLYPKFGPGQMFWSRPDSALLAFAVGELAALGLADPADLLDGLVLRTPKAYPGYYGSYGQFGVIRDFTDSIPNLFLIGRNGMHRYNNQDHSMLTARYAAEAILADLPDGRADKQGLGGLGGMDDTDGMEGRERENRRDGPASKRAIWEVNIDDDYHEQAAR